MRQAPPSPIRGPRALALACALAAAGLGGTARGAAGQELSSPDDGVAHALASEAPARLAVTVTPPLHETTGFRLAAVLFLVALAASVPALRARRLDAERLRLESEVAARTAELARLAQDLAREAADRRAAQAELHQSEERLRLIVEHATNVFFSHTPDGRLTYVSPQTHALLGMSPEETIAYFGTHLSDHPDNAAAAAATARAIATGEKQPPFELELISGSGERIWVRVNEAPVVRDGEVVAIVGALTDITAEKVSRANTERLEQQLRQASKMEAVGRLAGGIAHDFNNLLTAVVGHADMLRLELGPGHPGQEDVRGILDASGRATSLVAQLMAFSRQQLAQRKVIDANVVALEAARMLHRVIGADVALTVTPAAEPAWVLADSGQIDQILLNLVTNARDALPDGGRLVVRVAHETRRAALAEDVPAGRYVSLEVEDDGTGMDADTMARAFDPFFTTKGVGEGTGLGLATVYGIAKQNGGHAEIHSTPGRGTTVRVLLPAAEAPAIEDGTSVSFAGQPELDGARTVLVVEDEDIIRRLIVRALSAAGYRVLEAPNGPAGVALAERFEGPIDLLLTDVVMPGMSGREVAEAVAAARPGIRVLFMTGHTQGIIGGPSGLLPEGVEVLTKPFRPADLEYRIEALLA